MPELDLALTRPERVSETNPVSGDLFIQENGDTLVLDNADSEVQAIQLRIRTFEGEVYENPSAGLPWLTYILGNKQANPSVIKGFIRSAILARGTVSEVRRVSYSFDGATRAARIEFEGTFIDGTIFGDSYTNGVV